MLVWCLFMQRDENGIVLDYDTYGLYSSKEKAEEAMNWRRRKDGLYVGCRPDLLYNKCAIDTRIIDYNLPHKEDL